MVIDPQQRPPAVIDWRHNGVRVIKANQLDPREAFDRMTTDWIKFYLDVKPGHQNEIME